ncbi:MAG: phenylacetate--CoA ligase family protein [Cyanobacteria bacterium P01_D01_bin.156]
MLKALISYFLYPVLERQQKRQILPKLSALKTFAQRSPVERRRMSQQRLYETVAIAGRDVPYYRDVFQQRQFDPEKLKTDPQYLTDLPYLTKDILREQGERLLSETVDRSPLHVRKTGGSTGPSALIYYDQTALDWTAAANLQVLEWTGKKRYMKEVHFSSYFPAKPPLRDRLKESIKCISLNRVNITTDVFDPVSLGKILDAIKAERPYGVQGHPSTLYGLALYAHQENYPAKKLFTAFESTGEVLDDKKWQLIQTVFDCQIYNRYGNAEFGVVAHTTDDSPKHLRILDYMVWPEGRSVASADVQSDTQELVFTGLANAMMPLIRYCTGDLGDLVELDGDLYVTNIVGRVHDMVTIGERRYPTHYLQDVLDRLGSIDEFQVEQITPETLSLKLVLDDGANIDHIQTQIANWWGDSVAVDFVSFDSLSRQGWRSKFRHLVNQRSVSDA